jgi:hypothetical protein
MKADSLHRRLRFARPQPIDHSIVLSPRDIAIFETLHRHGPLPTNYLFEATKHLCRDYNSLQHRLTKLYNGTRDGTRYLTRPPQQFASFEARYQPLIYDLDRRSEQALAERGLRACFVPRRTDPFLHRFMGACVSLSLELTCKEQGARFISAESIFASAKCPAPTRDAANPLAIPLIQAGRSQALVPDNLFGIQLADHVFRFFVVEIDRATESIERRTAQQTAIARKVQAYVNVFHNRSYRTHWGIPNLHVLLVTTSESRAENVRRHVTGTGLMERFLIRAQPGFGANWSVPRGILRGILGVRKTCPVPGMAVTSARTVKVWSR